MLIFLLILLCSRVLAQAKLILGPSQALAEAPINRSRPDVKWFTALYILGFTYATWVLHMEMVTTFDRNSICTYKSPN
jgi:hypothetical protein